MRPLLLVLAVALLAVVLLDLDRPAPAGPASPLATGDAAPDLGKLRSGATEAVHDSAGSVVREAAAKPVQGTASAPAFRGRALTITVLDSTGRPIPKARASAYPTWSAGRQVSDANGLIHCEGIPPEIDALRIHHEDYREGALPIPADGAATAIVVLYPVRKLELQLADSTQPHGYFVELTLEPEMTARRHSRRPPYIPCPGWLQVGRAWTPEGFYQDRNGDNANWRFALAEDGRAVIDHIVVGGTLTMRLLRFGELVEERLIDLPQDQAEVRVLIKQPERAGNRGAVVDLQGAPLVGAELLLGVDRGCLSEGYLRVPRDPPWLATLNCDADGEYQLPMLPPSADELAILVRKPGYGTRVFLVHELDSGARIVLEPGRQVTMHAVDRHDAPVSEATFSSTQHTYYVSELVELGHGVWRHARGDPRIEARKTGAFFADLPPGVLRFSVDRFPLSDIAHHGTTNPTLFWKGSKANGELHLGK